MPIRSKERIHLLPTLHYTMEMAAVVRQIYQQLKPACIAVELPEPYEALFCHAASRLPDLSVIYGDQLVYLVEPCDSCFEGLRCGIEDQIPTYCIDLGINNYPLHRDYVPDPYAIVHIGAKAYADALRGGFPSGRFDQERESHMARRLTELALQYDSVLFIGGFAHCDRIYEALSLKQFTLYSHESAPSSLGTLTQEAAREVMAECAWITRHYEAWRTTDLTSLPDRQKLYLELYKKSATSYREETSLPFPHYHLRNIMKFVRNYALYKGRLMPDLFELLMGARGCVDHNYAYHVWETATDYPFLKNIDALPEKKLTCEEIWGHSKKIQFKLKDHRPPKEGYSFERNPFTLCSYPPEDLIVEQFGDFLKKKGRALLKEELSHTVPFTSSLEEGIDARETIRHWFEHKLYVKVRGKPPGHASSVVVIFDEDQDERYPWRTTWIGEHNQESDMAFYATPMGKEVVGPGISRCEYGGFVLTSPPGRLINVWDDPTYFGCETKSEVLLFAAIDYATLPIVVYVAAKPPHTRFKLLAERFGRKLVYLPIGQLSSVKLEKMRRFHVLDGHDKRDFADEYIF